MTISKEGRGKYQKLGVDTHNVGSEVLTMYSDGLSLKKMSRILASKGIKISAKAIGKWVKLKREGVVEKESTDLQNIQDFEVLCMDYQHEITNILDEVKMVKDEARESGNLEIYVKLIGKLYQGLELLGKLMGDIKPKGSVDINVIINKINEESFVNNKNIRSELFEHGKIFDVEYEIANSEVEEK